jgi:hypothetical protein
MEPKRQSSDDPAEAQELEFARVQRPCSQLNVAENKLAINGHG